MGHVDEKEIADIERRLPSGVTSAQVIAFFRERGMRLSEATFRRYVQLDLLPRCRRVGRKGKHRGSQGIYPVGVVRRLNEVKRLLDGNHTIDEVRQIFRVSEDDVETIKSRIGRVVEAAEEQARRDSDGILARHGEELRELALAVDRKLRQIGEHFLRRGERGLMAV